MKKTCKIFFIALILLTVLSAVFACTKKDEEKKYYTVSDIPEIAAAQADGTLYFEWLRPYDRYKQTTIVFHGEENAENKFCVNLSRSVYTRDVLTSTAGFKGRMSADASGSYYLLDEYWLDLAESNVAVFHWERFADESDTASVVAKIFSTYKSRYKIGGTYKDNVFSVSLADVAFALYLQETEKVSLSKKEIRFVGAGAGALLADAVASVAVRSGLKDIIPYRVALCDAPLSTGMLTFDVDWLNAKKEDGTAGLILKMNDLTVSSGVATEMYEAKEVHSSGGTYAYEYAAGTRDAEVVAAAKNSAAFLEISESYSSSATFDVYKKNKRIAFDWYFYSVIGSDDLSIGSVNSTDNSNLSVNNWGTNDRRPILNERSISNADPTNKGRNYGLSAWTPTVYVRALRGVSFTQKSNAVQSGHDINGKEKYRYRSEYVLDKFSSENYQVSDMSYSLLCGRLYYDQDGDNKIDDGAAQGYSGTLLFSLAYETADGKETIFSEMEITTGDDGFFAIRYYDAEDEKEGIVITKNEKGLVVLSGMCCKTKDLLSEFSFRYPQGKTNYFSKSVTGTFYAKMSGNNFSNNKLSVYFNKNTVHTVLIGNCLFVDN